MCWEAIAGPDPNDPTTYPHPFTYDAEYDPGRKFRIGILKDATEGAQDAVKANFEAALGALGDCAEVEEIEFPDLPYAQVTRTILMVESASAFEDFIAEGGPAGLTAPEDHYGPYARTAILASDYIKALRLRGIIAREVDAVMAGCDAIAAPTSLTTATPIDEQFRRTLAGPGDIIGGGGERLRSAISVGSERVRRGRNADRHTVHGEGIRRERVPCDWQTIPVPDRLAHAASRPT